MNREEKTVMSKIKMIALVALAGLLAGGRGVSVAVSAAEESLSVQLDETYIASAVVSDIPVELSAKVLNGDGNYVYGKELVWSVTSGEEIAEIRDGNLLYVTGEGSFTVRAALADDESICDHCECVSNQLTFSNVRILSKIENVTVYTQPVFLTGSIEVEGIDFPEDVHYELCYEVTEGPGYVSVGNYLYFTGEGTVKLLAYSRYDRSVSVLLEIPVTDPDKGLDADESEEFFQGNLQAEGGCSSVLSGGAAMSAVAFGIAFLIGKRRR